MLHWSSDGAQASASSTQSKPKARRVEEGNAADLQVVSTSAAPGLNSDTWHSESAGYPFQLQLVPAVMNGPGRGFEFDFSCPICLRGSELPIRQGCGHVLCLHCIQQGYMSVGGCPLCQTRQIFSSRAGSDPQMLPVTSAALSQVADTSVSTGMLSPVEFHQSNLAHTGFNAFPDAFPGPFAPHLLDSMMPTVSMGLDPTTGSSLGPEPGELHLDALSDFSDMIDLAELVSSDSEAQRPPPALPIPRHVNVAALQTTSGSIPTRPSRSTHRKVSGARPRSASAGPSTSRRAVVRSGSGPTGVGGKRKRKSVEGPAVPMQWEEVQTQGDKPEQRYDCGCTVHGSRLFVVGGIVGKLRLNDLYYIDLADGPTPTWVKPPILGDPPPMGSLLQIFVVDDTLYVIGGTSDGKFLSEVYAVNLAATEWTWEKVGVAGQPPSIRYWYSISVLGKILVLYGGYGHPNRLSDTFALRFDVPVPTWVELAPSGDIPGQSSTHSVCVYAGKMVMFGGYDGKFRRGSLYSFEIESVSVDSIDCVWRKVEARGKAPASRYTHTAAVVGSKMIVYGGNTGCLKGDVTVLDLAGDVPTWSPAKCKPPPSPREWHRVVVFDGAMYVFGGHTAAGNDNGLFRLTLQ